MDKLKGKQKQLDANNDGQISGEDFKLLREQKGLGGLSKLVSKLASLRDIKSKVDKELLTENVSKNTEKKLVKEQNNLDSQIEKLQSQIDEGTAYEKQASLQTEMNQLANELQQRGISENRIDEILEEVFDNRNYSELEEALSRTPKQEGGLLEDDREQYVVGGLSKILSKGISKVLKPNKVKQEINEIEKFLLDNKYPEADIYTKQELNKVKKEIGSDSEYLDFLSEFRAVKEADIDYIKRAKKNGMSSEEIKNNLKNLERNPKQEGGSMSIDDQMQMAMNQPMLPDEEMEDNYLDFIIDEALDEEEEDMLMSKLEQDEQLSMLFDKVIEVASEFAGSGPVEGPGSGVSDSIPARLSDGEFVFTAKATEQIGADELMRMMKDAEADADRQGMQEGGMMMQEEEVDQFGRPIDSDIARDELKKNMMSVNPRYR